MEMKFTQKIQAHYKVEADSEKIGTTNRKATVLMVLVDDLHKALQEKNEQKIKEEIMNLKEPIDSLIKLWN